MSKKCLSALAALCALLALGLVSVGQASASTLEDKTGTAAFLAIYGEPASNAAQPVGGGLGRNFGFGANMLFEACNTVTAGVCSHKVGENLSITIGTVPLEAGDTYIGGTLQSNKTPEITVSEVKHESPVGLAIQFVDFQKSTAAGSPAPTFSDTSDRHWITTICGEKASCKVGPKAGEEGAFLAKIENVSFNVGPGTVVQGTVWGKWEQGTATTPPCIKLTEPVVAADTLYETQGAAFGATAEKVKGKACLISANNYYGGTVEHEILLK